MASNTIILRYIDGLIRTGSHREAKNELLTILRTLVPRDEGPEVASLCRRLSIAEEGLRILRPFVRPSDRQSIIATPAERAEYASCLIRLGIITEAHHLLDQVSSKDYPKALIIRAFGFIAHFRHTESAEALKKYLSASPTNNYEALIAKVNLAQSLLFLGEVKETKNLLLSLREETLRTNNAYLYSNALEFSAMDEILNGNFSKAKQYIKKAKEQLSGSDVIDTLLLNIVECEAQIASGEISEGQNVLKDLRSESIKKKHWESIRRCDFLSAKFFRHVLDAKQVYWGTPYESYRRRFLQDCPWFTPDEHFDLNLGPELPSRILHLTNGVVLTQKKEFRVLKSKSATMNLLRALAADFYRPRSLIDLFQDLFPGEYYFKKHSSDRVHQLIRRLRNQLKHQKLFIEEQNGFYEIQGSEIALRKEYKTEQDNLSYQVRLICKKLKQKNYSAVQVAKMFSLSLRQAQRICREGVRLDLLVQVSRGPKTCFRPK